MKMICATDLLPKSDAAVARAGWMADRIGADLRLLHVVPVEGPLGSLEERLQTALGRMTRLAQPPAWQAQCAPHVGVLPGNPAQLIQAAVQEAKARVLVLGPHEHRPWRDLFDGTVLEKAIESKQCPVLVVRDTPRGSYQRVLLALDTSGASVSAVNAAAALVLTPEAAAQVVHVLEPPYAGIPAEDLGQLAEDRLSSIRRLLERERAYLGALDIRLSHGMPVAEILRSIEQYEPDLLVMGTRAMGRLGRTFLGSVASRVLSEVERDVLIVPEGSFVAPVRDRWGHRGSAVRNAGIGRGATIGGHPRENPLSPERVDARRAAEPGTEGTARGATGGVVRSGVQ